jgi:hypothetical protein
MGNPMGRYAKIRAPIRALHSLSHTEGDEGHDQATGRRLMFATLLGDLPRPPLPDDGPAEALVSAAVEAQVAAGLEPVTDGGWWGTLPAAEAWQRTARLTERAVKQVVVGPYSVARSGSSAPSASPWERAAAVLAGAKVANENLRALAQAGCPLIEIHEPAVVRIGTDAAGWALFREAQLILTDGIVGTHLSLAITGGSADPAGLPALLATPYASLAVDLIAGPDNWRLVRAMPGDRGIVCGALSPIAGSDDGPEMLLWAAAYASSGAGRGPGRVGLATASSLAALPWAIAIAKIGRLGEAVRLAELPSDELSRQLDPRSIDIRRAALGTAEPGNKVRRGT